MGIDKQDFQRRFGVELSDKFATEIADLQELDLIEIGERSVRLTARGRLFSNEVFARFI